MYKFVIGRYVVEIRTFKVTLYKVPIFIPLAHVWLLIDARRSYVGMGVAQRVIGAVND
jgi:hypothetical protein